TSCSMTTAIPRTCPQRKCPALRSPLWPLLHRLVIPPTLPAKNCRALICPGLIFPPLYFAPADSTKPDLLEPISTGRSSTRLGCWRQISLGQACNAPIFLLRKWCAPDLMELIFLMPAWWPILPAQVLLEPSSLAPTWLPI